MKTINAIRMGGAEMLPLVEGGKVTLRGTVLRPDGAQAFDEEVYGAAADAEIVGRTAGETIRGRLPAGFFEPH